MRVGSLESAEHPFWMPEFLLFCYFFLLVNSVFFFNMTGLICAFMLLLIQTSCSYKSISGSYLYWDALEFVVTVFELHNVC